MRRNFIFLFLTLATTLVQAQSSSVMEVVEEYNFGKIPQGKPVYYSFEIKNKGTAPLKIENVQTSCGCTTPEWSKDPIEPGASSNLKIGYNAASEGDFDKIITITYNGNEMKSLRIKGNVWKAPVGSAPANSSIKFLKQQMQ